MQELRYLKIDGEYLVAESESGESFRILVDDVLRKAVRKEPAASIATTTISPREIQLEVRAGMGLAELAAKSGAPLDYIEKFAAPVIDELAHVVQSALSVRITIAGDRYSETIQAEFGEVIANRLAAQGIIDQFWSSRKAENGSWLVTCHVQEQLATWSFDSRKLSLSPENELAVKLSTQQVVADSPIPKLRTLDSEPTQVPAAFAAQTSELAVTQEFEGVIPFGRSKPAEAPTEAVVEAAAKLAEPAEPAAPGSPALGEELANTADLLDALRKKRMQREEVSQIIDLPAEQPIAVPENTFTQDTAVIEVVQTETSPEVAAEPEALTKEATEPEAPVEAKPKKGRAAVPSWNDIVFGTKTDEN